MAEAEIGVIGGSGFYNMEGLAQASETMLNTPFGWPSGPVVVGVVNGKRVAFIARHGKGHRYGPSEVPAHANILALKELGVQWLISISAVGSLREEIRPLDIVIPDQLFDHTKRRRPSFFGEGAVVHVGMAEPYCPALSEALQLAATDAGVAVRRGGTYICIEGPQFSTKAESRVYRDWGMDIIGMTAVPEVKLAREAEMCYATLALVTDYDVWHESEEHVTVDLVVQNLLRNVDKAKSILNALVSRLPSGTACGCRTALGDALITQREAIPSSARERLKPLLGKYL